MKKIILGALLALSIPAAAYAANSLIVTEGPITAEELEQRGNVCMGYKLGEFDGSKIIEVYKLDTPRKRRDFQLQCDLFELGFKYGMET